MSNVIKERLPSMLPKRQAWKAYYLLVIEPSFLQVQS